MKVSCLLYCVLEFQGHNSHENLSNRIWADRSIYVSVRMLYIRKWYTYVEVTMSFFSGVRSCMSTSNMCTIITSQITLIKQFYLISLLNYFKISTKVFLIFKMTVFHQGRNVSLRARNCCLLLSAIWVSMKWTCCKNSNCLHCFLVDSTCDSSQPTRITLSSQVCDIIQLWSWLSTDHEIIFTFC